jgi:hypothetical protein
MAQTIDRAAITERLMTQQSGVADAIAILQTQLDRMTSEIDPDTATWADLGKFGCIADLAQRMVTECDESGVTA